MPGRGLTADKRGKGDSYDQTVDALDSWPDSQVVYQNAEAERLLGWYCVLRALRDA